jgi:hypothetical protein
MENTMRFWTGCLIAAGLMGATPAAPATRLKELVSLEGVRDNQLVGYGLVVGLAGTGDRRQTVFSAQSLTNMLERMGLSVPPAAIQVRNTAAAMVTASLPPFAQPGVHIDVTVAAIGDAPSLQGGLLLMTSLKAADGQVYAVSQGAVVTGGFIAGRAGSASVKRYIASGLWAAAQVLVVSSNAQRVLPVTVAVPATKVSTSGVAQVSLGGGGGSRQSPLWQVSGAVQVPQLAMERLSPQRSVRVVAPHSTAAAVQSSASVSPTHSSHWLLALQSSCVPQVPQLAMTCSTPHRSVAVSARL